MSDTGGQARVYVAGPMTGIPGHNVPAFDAAADRLRALGFAVVTPPDITRSLGRHVEGIGVDGSITPEAYRELVRLDIAELVKCHAIAMLPGWRNSAGAKVEYVVAAHAGLDIWTVAGLIAAAEAGGFLFRDVRPDLGPGHGFAFIVTGGE